MSTPDSVRIDLPLLVMLRNKTHAMITHGMVGTPWAILGHLVATPTHPETWKRDGQWRDDNRRHDLDIVAIRNLEKDEWIAFQGIELRRVKG